MDAYRREQRAQELKKQSKQRRAVKDTRLEGLDPLRVHFRLTQLQQKYQNSGFKKVYIPHHEQKQITRLEQDLADLKRQKGISEDDWKEMISDQQKREKRFKRFKHGLDDISDHNTPPQGQQRDSIFWDPIFNHRGVSPRGFPYISKSAALSRGKTSGEPDKDDVEFSSDEELSGVKLPSGLPPWKKPDETEGGRDTSARDGETGTNDQETRGSQGSRQTSAAVPEAKDVYESGPQVRNLAAEAARFVPRQVQLKQKREGKEKPKEVKGVAESKSASAASAASPSTSTQPMLEEEEEADATSIHIERVDEPSLETTETAAVELPVDAADVTLPQEIAPEPDATEIAVEEPAVEETAPETTEHHKLIIGGIKPDEEDPESEEEDEDDDALY